MSGSFRLFCLVANASAGRLLESYSKARTADAITALGSLRPAEALLLVPRTDNDDEKSFSDRDDLEKGDFVENGSLETTPGYRVQKVSVDLLEVGDVVRVQTGSTPPADGVVRPGQDTAFDESSMTGESTIVKKRAGDTVFLGTVNKSKSVDVQLTSIKGGTM